MDISLVKLTGSQTLYECVGEYISNGNTFFMLVEVRIQPDGTLFKMNKIYHINPMTVSEHIQYKEPQKLFDGSGEAEISLRYDK